MINKIAHLSDIHLRKLPSRNEEYEYVFNNLYKSLKSHTPQRIVLVGDLVHDYIDLGTEQLVLAQKFLKELAKIAPVIITRGNHDYRSSNKNRVDAIKAIIETIDDSNITYYNKTGLYEDDNIVWAVWHHGDKNNNPWKTKSGKEHLKNPDKKKIVVDLFHDPIHGCKSPSGFEMKKKSYYKLKDFKGDFLFAGDIHKQQYFNNKKSAYSSSLIAQDFSEGDENFHGYLLWDFSNYNGDDNFSVEEISVENKWSFKNIKLTPFTDFDELDYEIENPTEEMRIRIIWSTLPSTRNKENERKIISYLKNKYPNSIITHKNEFVEDDSINIDEEVTIENIVDQQTQHEIFKDYLDKIGLEDEMINDIIKFDDEISSRIEVDEITNIEWDIIKFGGTNFMSYKNIDIDWNEMDGLFQISGLNVGGKTTLIKAISYILFSQTLETKTRVKYGDSRFVNNKIDDDFCETYMVLKANDEYYGIKRRTNIERNSNGEIKGSPTTVQYHLLSSPDDEMNEKNSIDILNEDDKNKTQKKISRIIGSFDNFNRIVLTTSDTLNDVLSNDKSIFIDSLLYDSGLDVFDKKQTGAKNYEKDLNKKSRISCNVENTNIKIKSLGDENEEIEREIKDINENKLPEKNKKIKIGEEYVETLTKSLYKIDPEISNLDVEKTKDGIKIHDDNIQELEDRKKLLKKWIVPLKENYDVEKLNILTEKRDSHQQEINKIKLDKKDIERKKDQEDHEIEILNGKIFTLKNNGTKIREEIKKLKESKTCPTCGQLVTEEHRNHLQNQISDKEKEMYSIADEIKEINNKIEEHRTKITDHENQFKKLSDSINEKSLKMEDVLVEIGNINNDKNEVEKRKEYENELNQTPTKIQNEELKKSILQKKIDDYNNVQSQIEENEKINNRIVASKTKLETLRSEKSDLEQKITVKNNTIEQNKKEIKDLNQLITDFKEQEYQDEIIRIYKKCVHRDGIPRQLLSNYVIPKINVELENILSVAQFKVWLDVDELRPKLAYYYAPNAIIDAISSSGKERTFASIVLKLALNSINKKSKPMMFILDEVMGKLNENSVDEFIEILHVIKEKCKKILIIEHNHNVHPDHIISCENNNGISTAKFE